MHPLPTSTDLSGKTCGGFNCTSCLCLPVSQVPGFQMVSGSFWGSLFIYTRLTFIWADCRANATVDRARIQCVPPLVKIQTDQSAALRWCIEQGIAYSTKRNFMCVCVCVVGGPQLTLNISLVKSVLKKRKPGWQLTGTVEGDSLCEAASSASPYFSFGGLFHFLTQRSAAKLFITWGS